MYTKQEIQRLMELYFQRVEYIITDNLTVNVYGKYLEHNAYFVGLRYPSLKCNFHPVGSKGYKIHQLIKALKK